MANITLKPKNVTATMQAVFKVRKSDPKLKALRERFKEEECDKHKDKPAWPVPEA